MSLEDSNAINLNCKKKQTLNLDSSQIATFLDCPRKWYRSYIQRLTHVSGPPKEAMVMGTYGHALLDIYYKELARNGGDTYEAFKKAEPFEPELSLHCRNCDKVRGNHFTKNLYCQEPYDFQDELKTFNPAPFPLTLESRKLVKKRFEQYTLQYSAVKDIIPTSPDHVEVGFTHLLYEDDYYLFTLEGRIDLLGTLQGVPCIMDHKFQMRQNPLNSRAIQFKNYSLVTDIDMFVINYIRLTKEINQTTFQRQLTSFTKPFRELWRLQLIAVFKRIARAIKESEENPYYWLTSDSEPHWSSCDGKYGYTCEFIPLCEEPTLVEQKIQNLYHIKEEWKPW